MRASGAGRVTNHSERAGLALRIRLKMPAKRKRMTNDECDSVPLAHKTAESDRSRKDISRKRSVSSFSPNETTLDANVCMYL